MKKLNRLTAKMMLVDLELLTDAEIYERVMRDEIPNAKRSVLIATALVKQTTVEMDSGKSAPFLRLAEALGRRGVRVDLLIAGTPSAGFIKSLAEVQGTSPHLRIRLCARNHMKVVLIDGRRLYLGSANLTGAGMGLRSTHKRNFEFGVFTEDRRIIERISDVIRRIWVEEPCADCRVKRLCFSEHQKLAERLRVLPLSFQFND